MRCLSVEATRSACSKTFLADYQEQWQHLHNCSRLLLLLSYKTHCIQIKLASRVFLTFIIYLSIFIYINIDVKLNSLHVSPKKKKRTKLFWYALGDTLFHEYLLKTQDFYLLFFLQQNKKKLLYVKYNSINSIFECPEFFFFFLSVEMSTGSEGLIRDSKAV